MYEDHTVYTRVCLEEQGADQVTVSVEDDLGINEETDRHEDSRVRNCVWRSQLIDLGSTWGECLVLHMQQEPDPNWWFVWPTEETDSDEESSSEELSSDEDDQDC